MCLQGCHVMVNIAKIMFFDISDVRIFFFGKKSILPLTSLF